MKSIMKRVAALTLVGVAFAACSDGGSDSITGPEGVFTQFAATASISIDICKYYTAQEAQGDYDFSWELTPDVGAPTSGSFTVTAQDGVGVSTFDCPSADPQFTQTLTFDRGEGVTLVVTEDAVGEGTAVMDSPPIGLFPFANCSTVTSESDIRTTGVVEIRFDAAACIDGNYELFFKNIDKTDPPGGGEGCTPGFWRQDWPGTWPSPYTSSDLFVDVFGVDSFPGMTLGEVVAQGGGGIRALGRHSVAALLNAANDDVAYGMTAQNVIDAFNAAVAAGGDAIEDQKDEFDTLNNQGCPLDANPGGGRPGRGGR